MAWILSVVVRLTECSASVTASFLQLNWDATKTIYLWNGYSVWFLSHFWELTAAVFSADSCGVHLSMSEFYWVLLLIMLLRFFDMLFLWILTVNKQKISVEMLYYFCWNCFFFDLSKAADNDTFFVTALLDVKLLTALLEYSDAKYQL